MLVTDGGQLIRCPVDGIRVAGRATQGVIVFDTAEMERSSRSSASPSPKARKKRAKRGIEAGRAGTSSSFETPAHAGSSG